MPLQPGVRFGPYEILTPPGSGGMGEVYRARDPRLGRHVAIKVLPAAFSADPERLHRFEQEARAAAALNHPNIVTIHSVEEADGIRFLTMELVEGTSLADLIPKDGMPLDRLLKIAIPLAEALSAAHSKGIASPSVVVLPRYWRCARASAADSLNRTTLPRRRLSHT